MLSCWDAPAINISYFIHNYILNNANLAYKPILYLLSQQLNSFKFSFALSLKFALNFGLLLVHFSLFFRLPDVFKLFNVFIDVLDMSHACFINVLCD